MPDESSKYIEDLGKIHVTTSRTMCYHTTYLIRYDSLVRCVYLLQVYPQLPKPERMYLYRGCSPLAAQRIAVALMHFVEAVK